MTKFGADKLRIDYGSRKHNVIFFCYFLHEGSGCQVDVTALRRLAGSYLL